MNTEVILSLLRNLLAGGVGIVVGKGWLTPADAGLITSFATTVGPVLVPAVMSLYSHWGMKKVDEDAKVIDPQTGGR